MMVYTWLWAVGKKWMVSERTEYMGLYLINMFVLEIDLRILGINVIIDAIEVN